MPVCQVSCILHQTELILMPISEFPLVLAVSIKSSKFRKFNCSFLGTEYSSSMSFDKSLFSRKTGVFVSVSL